MDKQIHVLIFPAGEINSVELHDALASTVNVKVYGASSVDRHGPYIFENYISGLPFITDEKFIDAFNALIIEHSIDLIFPTHDTVAVFLSDNQTSLRAKVIGADSETTAVCRDKQKTYETFASTSFVPRVYASKEEAALPVFVKPKIGQGSVGAHLVKTAKELAAVDENENVISEYLPGEEYTVDCLTDRHGGLVVISPRERERTFGGVSVAAHNTPLGEDIKEIGKTINERLHFSGLWFFQVKRDSQGIFKLLEIAARCAGTMGLTRVMGANLPLLSVYVAMGYDVEAIPNNYNITLDRTLINRYKIDYDYSTVYLDFDDTLVMNERVNPYVIMFVYQCQAQRKTVHLITKHADDIHETLKRYGISDTLFASIIHLDQAEAKIDSLAPDGAIFIDNAFQERKYVHDKFEIPVFDVDAVESLLDWRS
jgi:hypothetical protein